METYISTIQFTDQGAKEIKATCERSAAFRTLAEKMGIEVKNIFWTLGPFNCLAILDAPDHETVTALMLHLGSFGNVRTQTVRAYEVAEMEQILGKLPD